MQLYRLLRSNKESGPYTWQEMKDLPLKAYDLVWVEGKSAAWRYPSEIEEFKSFAPPATEDLYMQFHTPSTSRNKRDETDPATTAVLTAKTGKSTGKKYVSVILPVIPEHEEETITIPSARPGKLRIMAPPAQEPAPAPAPLPLAPDPMAITEDPVPETYSVNPRKQPGSTLFRVFAILGTIAMLGLGVLAGYWLKNGFKNPWPNLSLSPAEALSPAPQVESPPPAVTAPPVNDLPPNQALDFASLKRFISVQTKDISIGLFAGIRNFNLAVSNNGNSDLDHIRVEVDFLRKDKSVAYSRTVELEELKKGDTKTIRVPGHTEAFAIRTRVTGINGVNAP